MSDKKEIRQEIVNYLCGEEGLKEKFIDLLKSGGLSEDEGYEIKEKLLNEIDSSKDFDLVFYTCFEGKDFPMKELSKYRDSPGKTIPSLSYSNKRDSHCQRKKDILLSRKLSFSKISSDV